MSKMSLRDKAFRTAYHSRFVALEDDMNRQLTDDEIRDEAKYLLECLPYSNTYDEATLSERAKLRRQLKAIAEA